jgi:cytochrome c oxidase cbb3-type subunit III
MIGAGYGVRRGRAVSGAVCGVLALVCTVGAVGCKRETRAYREIPPAAATQSVAVSDLHPGGGAPPTPGKTPDEMNAYALAEGKRLYSAYNCVGCHANGGGGMGPALIDDEWLYGHEADQIFHSILEGRPNGMPSFRGKIPDAHIWELAAYVRSLSGLAPKDAAPGRSDDMSGPPVPQSASREQPKNVSPGAIR